MSEKTANVDGRWRRQGGLLGVVVEVVEERLSGSRPGWCGCCELLLFKACRR